MDPRPRIYRAPLELNRINVVRRVPGRDHGPTVRRLDWHLWIELCNGARRLITCPSRCTVCGLNFGVAPLDASDRHGTFGAYTWRLGSGSARNVANRCRRNLVANRPTLYPAENKMGAKRCRRSSSE